MTLLQTEMWKVNPSAATQHVRELRSNINQLDLQIRLTERAKERLEREIKPEHAAGQGRRPRESSRTRRRSCTCERDYWTPIGRCSWRRATSCSTR